MTQPTFLQYRNIANTSVGLENDSLTERLFVTQIPLVSGQNPDGSPFLLNVVTAGSSSPPTAATAVITTVNVTNASSTVLASNTSRRGATIFNEGNGTVFIAFATVASATAYTVKLLAAQYYEMPSPTIYTGAIACITSGTDTAIMRVTELTP